MILLGIILALLPRLTLIFAVVHALKDLSFFYDTYFVLILLAFDIIIDLLLLIWWTLGDEPGATKGNEP